MALTLDKKTTGDLVRLLIFMITTGLATGLLVITIGNISFGATTTYKAEFVDATGVVNGDDVRVAGVKVGTVKDIEIIKNNRALVTFTVDAETRLDDATHATIRFRNLIGQRYIALTQEGQPGDELEEEDTIPVARTQPALDLTVLFNGFKPLFEALSPDDINKLSYEIVQVFQGEGGTLESLLSSTASLTQTLADRDQVIGELLDNLTHVLDHVADRDEQLGQLIVSFQDLVSGLKEDRQAILSSLDGISSLAVETAGLIDDIREPFVRDIKVARELLARLDRQKGEIDRVLQVMPIKINKYGRTGTYGSWFNFYLCHFKGEIQIGGDVVVPIPYSTNAGRCSLP
ncbi:MlaD family protein [Nocardioides bizhenqiangii]|uniref:MlaD family protein n=1 Tax=Nocardioides bizhenqiangii TaxID=3095076 RepID=A0ABZ0ZT34_9ACTN|nr:MULTISPECIES: MlaD family protein [unclassified Nocardioides]MDZ5622804.1 MlaD family protein [Nocardioides sp. HM23]WQQ27064.1 MlaD family protein [Nocardioides sp. HM61]